MQEASGKSVVCKTIREGFDSLLHLHILALDAMARVMFKLANRGRAWPLYAYANKDTRRLMLEKHAEMIDAKTRLWKLQKKHIEVSKELSRLKRSK